MKTKIKENMSTIEHCYETGIYAANGFLCEEAESTFVEHA